MTDVLDARTECRRSLATGHDTAIYRQHDAGDEARLIRREEQKSLRSVRHLAVAAEWVKRIERRESSLDLLGSQEGVVDRRFDDRRRNRIHTDLVGCKLDREVFHQCVYASLCRRIRRRWRRANRLQPPHRPGLHDAATAASTLHGLRCGLRGEERSLESTIKESIVLGFGELQERLWRKDASIVEQHIDMTELVERPFHNGLAGLGKRYVAGVRGRALPCRV